MVKVALVYNQIRVQMIENAPLDLIAEYDNEETISALRNALESAGHDVIALDADESIAERLRAVRPTIVFNIAEGLRGASRESHVPAICEMLGLPYTGSDPLTLALCLHKARAKEILLHRGIPTPRFRVINNATDTLQGELRFPLIVKLLHEGSSMGLSEDSVVDDPLALRRQVQRLLEIYHEPILIEEFIEGREFTVGILGNAPPRALPIVEVVFDSPRGIVLFSPDPAVVDLLRQQGLPEAQLQSKSQHRTVCPAAVSPELEARIKDTALRAYKALGCRDWCRLEMRLGPDDVLYVLELNPIAGIDPSYWLPRAAYAAGLSYADLINEILNHALSRNGHEIA